jgi:hypothetical protein
VLGLPSNLFVGELVPHTAHAMEVDRFFYVLLKVFSESEDKVINGTRAGVNIIAPYSLQNSFPAHHLTSVFNKQF